VGYTEIVCGAFLAFIPGPLKDLAALVVLILMSGAFYVHYALGDPFEQMVPAFIFTLLVFTRMLVKSQAEDRERQDKLEQLKAESKKSE
jgi:hypothetical protein